MVGPRSPELQPRTDAPNEWGRGGTSFSDELGWSWSWVRDALVLSRVPRWGGWSAVSGWNGNPPCSLPAANVIQMSPARPAAGARREHIPHPAAGATLPRAAPESWRGGGTHHLGRLPWVCVGGGYQWRGGPPSPSTWDQHSGALSCSPMHTCHQGGVAQLQAGTPSECEWAVTRNMVDPGWA